MTETAYTSAQRIELALRGYRQAVMRYEETKEQIEDDTNAVLLPVIEALWWARAADERYAKAFPRMYHDARSRDMDGRVLRGVRYVRNRCGHEQALVIVREGVRFPIRFPLLWGPAVRWKRLAQLPQPDDLTKGGEDDYEAHLAGDAAHQTFEKISAWFDKAADLFLGEPEANHGQTESGASLG